MEALLKGLFDYQRFEDHAALRSLIDSVHNRYPSGMLSMEELDQVSAAGTPEAFRPPEKQ